MATKTKRKARHTGSVFHDEPDGQPTDIQASEDGIRMLVHFDGEEEPRNVMLSPRHILSVESMREDWWQDFWGPLHEAEA